MYWSARQFDIRLALYRMISFKRDALILVKLVMSFLYCDAIEGSQLKLIVVNGASARKNKDLLS